jgi:hypothetical protein
LQTGHGIVALDVQDDAAPCQPCSHHHFPELGG